MSEPTHHESGAGGRHLQACAVPYRRHGTDVEYLLVTSSSGNRWIFPKGVVDPGFTPAETAREEAFEEAGARGELSPAPLARFERHKWGRSWEVQVFALRCDMVAEDWLENWRRRRWASYEEARALLGGPLSQVLEAVHRALG